MTDDVPEGRSRHPDPRGRVLLPEHDRRRDPRGDPSILDLGSVREADGDSADGWPESIDAPHLAGLDAHRGGDGHAEGHGADDGGDWTRLIDPDPDPDHRR